MEPTETCVAVPKGRPSSLNHELGDDEQRTTPCIAFGAAVGFWPAPSGMMLFRHVVSPDQDKEFFWPGDL